MGIYANSALKAFVEMVHNGIRGSILGSTLSLKLKVIHLGEGDWGVCEKRWEWEEKFSVRLKELEQQCEGFGLGSLMSSLFFFSFTFKRGVTLKWNFSKYVLHSTLIYLAKLQMSVMFICFSKF